MIEHSPEKRATAFCDLIRVVLSAIKSFLSLAQEKACIITSLIFVFILFCSFLFLYSRNLVGELV